MRSKATPIQTFAERLFSAMRAYEARDGKRLPVAALGERVGKTMGRGAFSAATVSQWQAGNQIPSISQVAAIATVLGVNPGWLAFGEWGRDALEKYNPASEPPDNYYTDITKPEKKADPVTKRRRA